MTMTPLIICPKTLFNGFALPQTLALGLLSAMGIVLGMVGGDPLPIVGLPNTLLILFTLYVVFSFLHTEPIHNGRKELGLQLTLIACFFLFSKYLTPEWIGYLALSTTIVLALNTIYARLQTLGIDPFFPNSVKAGGSITNAIGFIGNPNFLASYLSGAIWLGIYASVFYNYLLLIVVALALFVLYKTGSRAGQLGIAVSFWFFILMCSYFNIILNVIFHLGLAITIFGLLTFGMLLHDNWEKFFYSEIDPRGDQVWFATFRFRICYWICAWELIKRKPFFGWGLWGYRREIYNIQAMLHDRDSRFLNPKRYITPQPREVHNDFLEHIVEYGLFGFLVFMSFIGSIYYIGFNHLVGSVGKEFFFMLILLSGLTSILVDAIFFFALRLPTTALNFWLICGGIIGIGGENGVAALPGGLIAVFIIPLIIGFLWECVFKRVIASHYFVKHNMCGNEMMKGQLLMKAIEWAPHDSILRTHASIACQDYIPNLGMLHSMKLIEHFDGMTPLQVALFNVGLSATKVIDRFDFAEMFFKRSHYILTSFKPTLDMLSAKKGIGAFTSYKGGQTNMKIGNQETLWRVRTMIAEMERLRMAKELVALKMQNLNLEMANIDTNIKLAGSQLENSLIQEKKRMNIPDHWPFNPEGGEFMNPQEMGEEERKQYGIQGG